MFKKKLQHMKKLQATAVSFHSKNDGLGICQASPAIVIDIQAERVEVVQACSRCATHSGQNLGEVLLPSL